MKLTQEQKDMLDGKYGKGTAYGGGTALQKIFYRGGRDGVMKTLFTELRQLLEQGEEAVLVTIIASSGSTPRGTGSRMLEGRVHRRNRGRGRRGVPGYTGSP